MKKDIMLMPIKELRQKAPSISFPEYQRESTVWNRRAQQRLIGSIIRGFDISAFYFYRTEDGDLECIDGRQRIIAILSFTGDLRNGEHEPYRMLFENEIAPEDSPELASLNGLTFKDLERSEDGFHREALDRFNEFTITVVVLSESENEFELNLQFTRLNLGVILNSGEKLHAMQGDMRDLCFERLAEHEFVNNIGIPMRRFAIQQVAAQFLCEIYSLEETEAFRRIRHFDLQKFFKQKFHMSDKDKGIAEKVDAFLTELRVVFTDDLALLRNRALTVSLVLLAWVNRGQLHNLPPFLRHFTQRLNEQLEKIKNLEAVDDEYRWLIEFQQDVTQASVEKPAVTRRHEILSAELKRFVDKGKIQGDP